MEKTEREIVYAILLEAEKAEGSRGFSLVKDHLDRYADLSDAQRSFVKRMASGCIGDKLRLDAVIDRFSKKPASKMKPAVRVLLRMGIYQILSMDAVSDAAAVNGQILLARKVGLSSLTGFLNGLLRNVARNRESIREAIQKEAPREVRFAIPEWILSLWEEQYGAAQAEKIALSSGEVRPVSIRFSAQLGDEETEALKEAIREKGAEITPSPLLPYAYALRNCADLRALPGFAQGKITVQDVSSMLVTEAADLQGGETILDLCAAPGGKTSHMADVLLAKKKGGRVHAFDKNMKKVRRMEENLQRLGLTEIADAAVGDASVLREELMESADVVLCDVPCSGLGVLSKKQDIRYRVKPEELTELSELQRKILTCAAQYVKKGGVLLYSTCTVNKEENDRNAAFAEKELGLIPDDIVSRLPEDIGANGHMLQLFPGANDTDGFFIARFRRPL